ncbi:MAG: hypothetical protein Q9166_003999 [cf. Caloplaca sp. 2 TL-2023]
MALGPTASGPQDADVTSTSPHDWQTLKRKRPVTEDWDTLSENSGPQAVRRLPPGDGDVDTPTNDEEGINDSSASDGMASQRDKESVSGLHDSEFDDADGCGEDEEGSDFDEFEDLPWLKSLNVDRKDSTGIVIGHCHAKVIDREPIRHSFHHSLEEPSQDTAALAFGLFDRWGCLKSEFRQHPIKKGTGVWGRELDQGRFLLIEFVTVDKSHRRQGHGKALVDEIWEKARSLYPDLQHAIVWATHLNSNALDTTTAEMTPDAARSMRDGLHLAVEEFFKAMSFRRIGSSPWFARTEDPVHPSRALAASKDYKRPLALHLPAFKEGQLYPYDATMLMSEEESEEAKWEPKPEGIPPRSTILHTNDDRTLDMLKDRLKAHPATDAVWDATDNEGNTIMHVVAIDAKVKSLIWLLGQPFADTLKGTRNLEGETPLEALQAALETHRVQTEVGMMTVPLSDKFDGFTPAETVCLLKLKGIPPTSDIVVDRIRFGCTCGECIGGFLSPQVAFALACQGNQYHDMTDVNSGFTATGVTTTGADWCEWWHHMLSDIPADVRANMRTNKSLRQGFTNLLRYTAQCIEEARLIPTTPNVIQLVDEWPPHVKNYLKRGGTVSSAVLACFDNAIDQDMYLGNGPLEKLYSEDIEQLKPCRNDHEFAFVRRHYRKLEGLKGDQTYVRGPEPPMTASNMMRMLRHTRANEMLRRWDE